MLARNYSITCWLNDKGWDMKCKACGQAILESNLIACPHCGEDPSIEPPTHLSQAQIKSIGKQLRGEFIRGILYCSGCFPSSLASD